MNGEIIEIVPTFLSFYEMRNDCLYLTPYKFNKLISLKYYNDGI